MNFSCVAQIRHIINKDLGAPPELLFATFEQNPIASASLAQASGHASHDSSLYFILRFPHRPTQVHVATGHNGQKLAVKIQHAGLRETAVADISTISFLVRAVRFVFPVWRVASTQKQLGPDQDFGEI